MPLPHFPSINRVITLTSIKDIIMAAPKDVTTDETVVDAEVLSEGSQSRGVMDVATAIANLNNTEAAFYTSIQGTNFEARKLIARAQTVSVPLADNLGKEIALTNFIVQSVTLEDEKTGETTDAPRVTLIDGDGTAYHATSTGLLTALRNLLTTVGEPAGWPEALPIQVVEKRSRQGGYRYMTIELV